MTRRRALLAAAAAYLAAATVPATAAERDGVILPDRLEAAGATLTLNGTATRTYSVLRIRVYVAGLYLEQPARDADAVLASPDVKAVVVRYLQPVKRDDAIAAWRHYLTANCPAPSCRMPADALARFEAALGPVRKGDTQRFLFTPDGVEVAASEFGPAATAIPDPTFARLLLATWIGTVPTSEAVKRGLLAGAAPG